VVSKTCCLIKNTHILTVYNVKTSITIIAAYECLRFGIIGSALYFMVAATAIAIVVSAMLKVVLSATLEDLAL